MAFIASHATASGHPSILARSLSAIGGFFVSYAEARSHMNEIRHLEEKSDAELAEIGLTREGIVRHVFSDSLYL